MRLIDADELIKRLEKDPLFPLVEQYNISGVIENAPTIEAEPVKHGRWKCESDMETYTIWRCSECGIGFEHTSPYCRNCGAKMGGEEA